jgi:hypothetical protein
MMALTEAIVESYSLLEPEECAAMDGNGEMEMVGYSVRQKKRAFFENYAVFQMPANESP